LSAVAVPVLVAPLKAEKYVRPKFTTPPMSGVTTPAVVRLITAPEREYRIVAPLPSTKVTSVALGIAVTTVAERSSRTMSSSATRPFCWASTRWEPMR
jgi:hypothetical protein